VRWSPLLLSLLEAEVEVESYSCLIQPLEPLIFIYADLFLVLRRCLVKILAKISSLCHDFSVYYCVLNLPTLLTGYSFLILAVPID
jgi:hypothetical protein